MIGMRCKQYVYGSQKIASTDDAGRLRMDTVQGESIRCWEGQIWQKTYQTDDEDAEVLRMWYAYEKDGWHVVFETSPYSSGRPIEYLRMDKIIHHEQYTVEFVIHAWAGLPTELDQYPEVKSPPGLGATLRGILVQ